MMRRGSRLVVVRAALAVGTLALLALLLQGAAVPHVHDAPGVGLYNQEHDLTALAASSGGALVPGAPGVPIAVVVVLAFLLVTPRPLSAPRSLAASRAPPAR